MQRRFELLVENQKLIGDVDLPDSLKKPFPVMICSHGLATNRKRGKWPKIAERFPEEGIVVINFDHRGASEGESEGSFEDTTLTRRVGDLEAAIEFSKTIPEIDQDKIVLLGSSLGGKTALLAASRSDKIRGLILLATPFASRPSSEEMKRSFEEKGIRIKKDFYEDFKRYDIKEICQKISCKTLILHGILDEQVPRHQAHVLKVHLGHADCQLIEIEGADHAFTKPEKLNEVLDLISDWLKKLLRKEVK